MIYDMNGDLPHENSLLKNFKLYMQEYEYYIILRELNLGG
jgi:hypothetical protein